MNTHNQSLRVVGDLCEVRPTVDSAFILRTNQGTLVIETEYHNCHDSLTFFTNTLGLDLDAVYVQATPAIFPQGRHMDLTASDTLLFLASGKIVNVIVPGAGAICIVHPGE